MTDSKSELSLDLLKLAAAKAKYQRYLRGEPRLSKSRKRPRMPEKIELMREMGRLKQKLYPSQTIVCDWKDCIYLPFFDRNFKPTPKRR